jgi:hypothetical protein
VPSKIPASEEAGYNNSTTLAQLLQVASSEARVLVSTNAGAPLYFKDLVNS